jgi:hypothetical protein
MDHLVPLDQLVAATTREGRPEFDADLGGYVDALFGSDGLLILRFEQAEHPDDRTEYTSTTRQFIEVELLIKVLARHLHCVEDEIREELLEAVERFA